MHWLILCHLQMQRGSAVASPNFTLNVNMTTCCAYAGQFPYVIRELLGPRSFSTIHGQYHTQVRKLINPHFTPKAVAPYTPRLVEIAQQICTELADADKPKGEDAMKKFTFKVFLQVCASIAICWECFGMHMRFKAAAAVAAVPLPGCTCKLNEA